MHLGRPTGMTFDQIADDNPDWLNRVLARKKECDLGVAFHDGHPTQHGIPSAVWNNRPPGTPMRPTTIEAWRADQAALTAFLARLGAGELAVAPRQPWVTPVQILLGDFLGESGVIRNDSGALTHGVRIEMFSPALVAPTFTLVPEQNEWNPPSGLAAPCAKYVSEWARPVTDADRVRFAAIGVDPELVAWWSSVALLQLLDGTLPTEAKLPLIGSVVHYRPLDFARWINQVTWEHEWPKYKVNDASGNPVTQTPPRPRSRRVT
jgi:hypothetical protein